MSVYFFELKNTPLRFKKIRSKKIISKYWFRGFKKFSQKKIALNFELLATMDLQIRLNGKIKK